MVWVTGTAELIIMGWGAIAMRVSLANADVRISLWDITIAIAVEDAEEWEDMGGSDSTAFTIIIETPNNGIDFILL